ncbi:MAG: dihydrodipicolinate synthase family protein [Blastocatellia bacterium]
MHYLPRKGLSVPVITVVDASGRVVENEQRNLIRHVIQGGRGADVIFANGTTGEWNRIDNTQRQRLMAMAVEETQDINTSLFTTGQQPVEVWLGLNGDTRAEVLDNLDRAIQLNADAVVIAPLAIRDLAEDDIARFFLRDMNARIERAAQPMPVFLYDNADINAPDRAPHIRTHLVKQLGRLPWVCGIKVSASRTVLGNYTRAALHFKQPGEFGIYVGNANLIFEWFHPQHGFAGRLREGWRDWLLHDTLPIGVVSGPGNVFPREWQKAWRVCWAGDEELIGVYEQAFTGFEDVCRFSQAGGVYAQKMIACLKYALELDGVISASHVAPGTAALTENEKDLFRERYAEMRKKLAASTESLWQTTRDE